MTNPRPVTLILGCVIGAAIWTALMTVISGGPVTLGRVVVGLLVGFVSALAVTWALQRSAT
jgi:hypothetical protein